MALEQLEPEYQQMRDIWDDHNQRQKFEHELINRQTTWLLTTQSILFAAYGVTFESTRPDTEVMTFRIVVACSGFLIAVAALYGVAYLIKAKWRSWKEYQGYFARPDTPHLPDPLDGKPPKLLEWGVETATTKRTLVPDVVPACVFIVAWLALFVSAV